MSHQGKPGARMDDPNVKIPASVKAAAARSDAIHQEAYQTPPVDPPAPPPDNQNTPENLAAPAAAPAETAAPAPPPAAADAPKIDPNSWEARYTAMLGRFRQSETEKNQLGNRIGELERMLSLMQSSAPVAPPPNDPAQVASTLLTQEEQDSYGPELLDVIGRRAREAMKSELDSRDQEIAHLKTQIAGVSGVVTADARQAMLNVLTQQVPDWSTLNSDQNFISWLNLQDPYSGAIRLELLRQAWERNDSLRVLAFFKGFLEQEAAVTPATTVPLAAPAPKEGLEQFAAPGRVRSAAVANGASPAKPIISRLEIANFYADVRAGKYAGRDAEKNQLENQIFEAERDRRIRL